MENKKLL